MCLCNHKHADLLGLFSWRSCRHIATSASNLPPGKAIILYRPPSGEKHLEIAEAGGGLTALSSDLYDEGI